MTDLVLDAGQTLAYDRYGAPQAPPVVLLHGLSSNRRVYTHLASDLAEDLAAGRLQLINLDLRGHGESSHAPAGQYTAQDYAADVAALLKALGVASATVVAESLGGVVAVALAQRAPGLVRALLLEDPPLFLGEPDRLSQNPVSAGFPEFIALIESMQARGATPEEYRAALSTPDESDEIDETSRYLEGIARWDAASMRAALDGTLWDGCRPLEGLRSSLTILRADPACGASFEERDIAPLQAAHPAARIVLIPGATHSVRASQHGAFTREVRRFLAHALPGDAEMQAPR